VKPATAWEMNEMVTKAKKTDRGLHAKRLFNIVIVSYVDDA
jgi:hypothetical protein